MKREWMCESDRVEVLLSLKSMPALELWSTHTHTLKGEGGVP